VLIVRRKLNELPAERFLCLLLERRIRNEHLRVRPGVRAGLDVRLPWVAYGALVHAAHALVLLDTRHLLLASPCSRSGANQLGPQEQQTRSDHAVINATFALD